MGDALYVWDMIFILYKKSYQHFLSHGTFLPITGATIDFRNSVWMESRAVCWRRQGVSHSRTYHSVIRGVNDSRLFINTLAQSST